MDIVFLVARILFSAIFISSGLNHLTSFGEMSEYAANKNIPLPTFSIIVSGLMLLLGGLSILLGYGVNFGAWLLILFLFPAAFMVHNFWVIQDPETRQNEQIHFFKDMSLAGGAFFIWYLAVTLGSLPWSIRAVI